MDQAKPIKSKRKGDKPIQVLTYGGLMIVAIVNLFPIVYNILVSFKTLNEIFTFPPTLLFTPTLENWRLVVVESDFLRFYGNSLIISTLTVIGVLLLSSLAGYGLARFPVPRRDDIAFWFLSQGMLPVIAVILPLYLLYVRLKLVDTYLGIVMIYIAINLSFAVWLMRDFFAGLPIELEEAALVDGANPLQVFWLVSLPLAKPGLLAVAVYTFVLSINEFFLGFVLTSSKVQPAAVAIVSFLPTNVRGTLYGQAAVAATLVMIPAVILFLFLQRYLIAGITLGAVKE